MGGRIMFADPRVLAAAAVLLAAVEVFIDFTTWIQLNVSIAYELPLVLAAASRSRRLVWIMALALVTATFAIYAVQMPPGAFHFGEPFFVNRVLAATSVLIAAGLLHALISAVDALDTRRRELDQQRMEAEEASERKTRLLMSVSHDLRTPLTTINLMAELVKASASTPDLLKKVPALADTLHANALVLSDMVTDVLDVSHVESGRVTLHETEFPIRELVQEECALMEALAAAAGLALKPEAVQPAIWLRADRVKLGRILRNLLKNAIQFTRTGGITVAAALDASGGLRIRVVDTGVGIARDDLERIFAEFTQLRGPESGETGWGLGLAICRRLARLMDGEVSIESELNRGSIVTVTLPPSRVILRSDSPKPRLKQL
jgi:signal transduction histidine kinase